MPLPGRLEPKNTQRALAAALSAVLHLCLLVVIAMSGGRHVGTGASESPSTQLVLIEAAEADRREGLDLAPLEPAAAMVEVAEQQPIAVEPPAALPGDAETPQLADAPVAPPAESPVEAVVIPTEAITAVPTVTMPQAHKTALEQYLARLVAKAVNERPTQVNWEQNGIKYSAVLITERANDGTALERVIAEVSAADRGKQLSTRILLKRLAFSQFTQMVDSWDPMVQLHDDVIVGRFHSNSRFNVLYDSRTAPQFTGKVTTSARSFDLQSAGRRREQDIFRAGVETRSDRIDLPEGLRPSEWAPHDDNARVHELRNDTRIRFFEDGSYTWRTHGAPATGYINSPSEHPVYFIGAPGATLNVSGVVAGKILVYSPQKIVIEGDITYARDPRRIAASDDYLGLVSDKYVEIAPPDVTGPGDLEIHAAIFAGRRFVVRDVEHRRPATLRIYGSLAAGSLSASEPRYATKIEYDERFERRRPPGFPFTDRYEADNWDGSWTQAPERTADDTL